MWGKSSWIVVLVAFGLACGSFTFSLIVQAGAHARTCEVVHAVAQVEEQKAREERPNTERFERESKDRFGLSQERFDELIEQTRRVQEDRALKLALLAHKSC